MANNYPTAEELTRQEIARKKLLGTVGRVVMKPMMPSKKKPSAKPQSKKAQSKKAAPGSRLAKARARRDKLMVARGKLRTQGVTRKTIPLAKSEIQRMKEINRKLRAKKKSKKG